MKVSCRIKWSLVPLLFWNPVCIFVIRPFVSRYHIRVYCLSSTPSSYQGSYSMRWVDNSADSMYLCWFGDRDNYWLSSYFWESTVHHYIALVGIWLIHLVAAWETHCVFYQDRQLRGWIFLWSPLVQLG